MDKAFEFLFKYRPSLFHQGELTLTAGPVWLALAIAFACIAVLVVLGTAPRGVTTRQRWTLIGLRSAVVTVLCLCLLQPALLLTTVVPQQSFVGILADDSRSMQIADVDDQPRSVQLTRTLTQAPGSFLERLEQRFRVRSFAFAGDAHRIESPLELGFKGSHTRLDKALAVASDELGAVPLSGLVLLTDGAQSSGEQLDETLLKLRSRGVPVYPVGVGLQRFARDIELSRVEAPRNVLLGSALQVDVTLSQSGFSGSTVRLEVEDEGRIVSAQDVRFPAGGEAAIAKVTFNAETAGPRRFRFRVAPQPGEILSANNERWAVIDVQDRAEKILYFEGEPRYEVGFIRRHVNPDKGISLDTMARLAENRIARFVNDEQDVFPSFPDTREELFRYKGLILGSIEASFFTYDQMRMIADFVDRRGGGVLFLGGRSSFAEGGYTGTPIAEIMPVVLGTAAGGEGEPYFTRIKVRPTPAGRNHPVTRLVPPSAADPERAERELWESLPELSIFNPLTQLKPGASALLMGESAEHGDQFIVLAHQRYGRGRVVAFAPHDSWNWQMQMPLEDLTFETFWRQMLRWLVSYVPDPVEAWADADRVEPGEPFTLSADVRDKQFLEVNRARVEAKIVAPDGTEAVQPLEWSVDQDGRFTSSLTVPESGMYKIMVDAEADGEQLGQSTFFVEGAALEDELFGAEQRRDLLDRIASETGGKTYDIDQIDALLDDLTYSASGATVREYRDLWDAPVFLLALIGLLGTEWALRRWRGLA